MKKIFAIVLFVLLSSISYSTYCQNWIWANGAGGVNSGDGGSSICLDENGCSYISGTFMGVAYFHTDTLTSNGFNDFFIAKYDADGNEVWVKQFGGYNTVGVFEPLPIIVYDTISQAIYFAGSFIGDCVFGMTTLHSTPYTKSLFLTKLNSNGICQWAKAAGGAGSEGCNGISVYGDNIFLTGYLQYGGVFDTININAGGFIAKYDTAGNCMLVKKIITGGSAYSLKKFDSDFFVFGATTDSVIIVDTIQIHFQNINYGKFLARLDSSYNVKWLQTMGGPKNNGGINFSMDNSGNCYIGGGFKKGFALFDNDTIFSDTSDYYLAKYDQNGNFKWVQQGKSTKGASASSVFSDVIGNTYITGYFSGNANFGSYNVTSSDGGDMFIARYDSSGNCFGIRNVANAGGGSVISDAYSNAYVTGGFVDTAYFGSNTLISHGNSDIFVAKIDAFTGIGGGLKTTNNQLLIYANPNSGKCNINIPDDFLKEKNLVLSIFDNSGKIIQQKTLAMNDGKIKLDLQAEAKGIYNVTLTNGKKMYSGKIVFQ